MRLLMYKPVTKVEKVCRWALYILLFPSVSYMIYLKWIVYPHLTKPEFAKQVWGNGNWIYLILLILVFVFLYVRSNLTAFKKMDKWKRKRN